MSAIVVVGMVDEDDERSRSTIISLEKLSPPNVADAMGLCFPKSLQDLLLGKEGQGLLDPTAPLAERPYDVPAHLGLSATPRILCCCNLWCCNMFWLDPKTKVRRSQAIVTAFSSSSGLGGGEEAAEQNEGPRGGDEPPIEAVSRDTPGDPDGVVRRVQADSGLLLQPRPRS